MIGRPSAVNSPNRTANSKRHGKQRPLREVQLDATNHIPRFDNKEATRCKNVNC